MGVKGYKVFNSDWTCRDKQYTCPGYFEEDCKPELCKKGMHFCKNLEDYFSYYEYTENIHVAEVMAVGEVIEEEDGIKCVTNKLVIIRELSKEEIYEKGNTGSNNKGVCNIGVVNNGFANVGKYNIGIKNNGFANRGNYNKGTRNSGNNNCGSCNNGNCNIGKDNIGHYNTGKVNNGTNNTGEFNSGEHNIGFGNEGTQNVGIGNRGENNVGFFNKGTNCVGFFCTETPPLYVFNKPVDPEYFFKNYWKYEPILSLIAKKVITFTQADVEIISTLPNFDPEIFKEITGIDYFKDLLLIKGEIKNE